LAATVIGAILGNNMVNSRGTAVQKAPGKIVEKIPAKASVSGVAKAITKKDNPKAISNTSEKTIYLTFDDGPSKLTLKNLDTLKKSDVKATFFLLPHQGEDEIYKKIVDEGHVIGSHSYSHLNNKEIFLNSEAFEKDLKKSLKFLKEKTGVEPLVYRCPGGAFWRNKSFKARFEESLSKYDMRAFDWTLSSCDTDMNFVRKNKDNPELIIQKFKNNIVIGIEHTKMKNIVVLMHDTQDKIYTAEAIKLALPELVAKGYKFSTLDKFPTDGIYR